MVLMVLYYVLAAPHRLGRTCLRSFSAPVTSVTAARSCPGEQAPPLSARRRACAPSVVLMPPKSRMVAKSYSSTVAALQRTGVG